MKKNMIIIFGFTALFLGLAILPATSLGFSETFMNQDDTVEEIIIFRIGPRGTMKKTAIHMDTTDITETLGTKCRELFENDDELQQFTDENIFFRQVESQGYGFHFSMFRPIFLSRFLFRSTIRFRYFYEDAYTKIDNQTLATGPHKGRILGFIGYICFSKMFFGDVTIYGYSTFRIDIKPIS